MYKNEIFKWKFGCPWICWNKESLTRTAASSEKTPWVVLEKELETSLSLLNSTTALMDQHQLNHQFCGQSQHTQHIQQKKSKKRSLFRTASIHKHHKKNHTLRHIFLQEKKCLFRPHFSQYIFVNYKCTEVFQNETFLRFSTTVHTIMSWNMKRSS